MFHPALQLNCAVYSGILFYMCMNTSDQFENNCAEATKMEYDSVEDCLKNLRYLDDEYKALDVRRNYS